MDRYSRRSTVEIGRGNHYSNIRYSPPPPHPRRSSTLRSEDWDDIEGRRAPYMDRPGDAYSSDDYYIEVQTKRPSRPERPYYEDRLAPGAPVLYESHSHTRKDREDRRQLKVREKPPIERIPRTVVTRTVDPAPPVEVRAVNRKSPSQHVPGLYQTVFDVNHPQDATVHLELPISDDYENELEVFSRLRRLGNFKAAEQYFKEHLESYLKNPYVFVQYAEMLLDRGDYIAFEKLNPEPVFGKDDGPVPPASIPHVPREEVVVIERAPEAHSRSDSPVVPERPVRRARFESDERQTVREERDPRRSRSRERTRTTYVDGPQYTSPVRITPAGVEENQPLIIRERHRSRSPPEPNVINLSRTAERERVRVVRSPPTRPGLLRRQSSLDTFDRRPRDYFYEREEYGHPIYRDEIVIGRTTEHDELELLHRNWRLLKAVAKMNLSGTFNEALNEARFAIDDFQFAADMGSTEIQIVALTLQIVARIAFVAPNYYFDGFLEALEQWVPWAAMRKQLLVQGRIWDFRDVFVAAVSALGSEIDDLFFPGVDDSSESLVKDWIVDEKDESTNLAQLDMLLSPALGVRSFYKMVRVRPDFLKEARHRAEAIMAYSPAAMKSRPFLRWIITNAAEAMFSEKNGLKDPWASFATHLQDFPGKMCGNHDWFRSVLYVPRNSENPGWVVPDVPSETIEPIQMALNLAKELQDYECQVSCYKLLIYQSQNPGKWFKELANLQKVQGDQHGHMETLLSSYLVTKGRPAKEKLLEELKATDDWDDTSVMRNNLSYFARDFIERALKRSLEGPKSEAQLRKPGMVYFGRGLPAEIEEFAQDNSGFDVPPPGYPFIANRYYYEDYYQPRRRPSPPPPPPPPGWYEEGEIYYGRTPAPPPVPVRSQAQSYYSAHYGDIEADRQRRSEREVEWREREFERRERRELEEQRRREEERELIHRRVEEKEQEKRAEAEAKTREKKKRRKEEGAVKAAAEQKMDIRAQETRERLERAEQALRDQEERLRRAENRQHNDRFEEQVKKKPKRSRESSVVLDDDDEVVVIEEHSPVDKDSYYDDDRSSRDDTSDDNDYTIRFPDGDKLRLSELLTDNKSARLGELLGKKQSITVTMQDDEEDEVGTLKVSREDSHIVVDSHKKMKYYKGNVLVAGEDDDDDSESESRRRRRRRRSRRGDSDDLGEEGPENTSMALVLYDREYAARFPDPHSEEIPSNPPSRPMSRNRSPDYNDQPASDTAQNQDPGLGSDVHRARDWSHDANEQQEREQQRQPAEEQRRIDEAVRVAVEQERVRVAAEKEKRRQERRERRKREKEQAFNRGDDDAKAEVPHDKTQEGTIQAGPRTAKGTENQDDEHGVAREPEEANQHEAEVVEEDDPWGFWGSKKTRKKNSKKTSTWDFADPEPEPEPAPAAPEPEPDIEPEPDRGQGIEERLAREAEEAAKIEREDEEMDSLRAKKLTTSEKVRLRVLTENAERRAAERATTEAAQTTKKPPAGDVLVIEESTPTQNKTSEDPSVISELDDLVEHERRVSEDLRAHNERIANRHPKDGAVKSQEPPTKETRPASPNKKRQAVDWDDIVAKEREKQEKLSGKRTMTGRDGGMRTVTQDSTGVWDSWDEIKRSNPHKRILPTPVASSTHIEPPRPSTRPAVAREPSYSREHDGIQPLVRRTTPRDRDWDRFDSPRRRSTFVIDADGRPHAARATTEHRRFFGGETAAHATERDAEAGYRLHVERDEAAGFRGAGRSSLRYPSAVAAEKRPQRPVSVPGSRVVVENRPATVYPNPDPLPASAAAKLERESSLRKKKKASPLREEDQETEEEDQAQPQSPRPQSSSKNGESSKQGALLDPKQGISRKPTVADPEPGDE